jgi:alpha-beta hydrolase superfamily lysophospholipase
VILQTLLTGLFCILAWAHSAADTFPNATRDLRNTPVYGSLTSDDGTKLSYSVIGGDSGNLRPLVLVQGKGESAFRYIEFAHEMQKKGYGPFYILDHRGQGFSEKILKDAVHVEDFNSYVKDFIKFMDGPVKADLLKRGFTGAPGMVAHSMGGTIANLALRLRPDLASRIAYISPMFALELSHMLAAWQNKPLQFLSGTMRAVGLGEMTFGPKVNEFHSRLLSSDIERIRTSYDLERERNIRMSKTSASWMNEAIKATQLIEQPDKPQIPSLIFRGEYETLISNSALMNYACSVENCTLIELPGGHAGHQERDPVRYILEDKLDDFLQGREITPPGIGCERWYKVLVP